MNITYSTTISHETTPAMNATDDVRNDHDDDMAVRASCFHSSRDSRRDSSSKSMFSRIILCHDSDR